MNPESFLPKRKVVAQKKRKQPPISLPVCTFELQEEITCKWEEMCQFFGKSECVRFWDMLRNA